MIAVPPGVHILLATQPVDFRDSVRWAASVSRGRYHFMRAILDNYGTHKRPKVLAWLGRHPRWTFVPLHPDLGLVA